MSKRTLSVEVLSNNKQKLYRMANKKRVQATEYGAQKDSPNGVIKCVRVDMHFPSPWFRFAFIRVGWSFPWST